jgi:hypothetical protein
MIASFRSFTSNFGFNSSFMYVSRKEIRAVGFNAPCRPALKED